MADAVADTDAVLHVEHGALHDLPVERIDPNPWQPREVFDEDDLAELVSSIRVCGLLQPILVRPAGDGRWQVIAGERRLRACRQIGMQHIAAVVRETSDEQMRRDALVENLQRADLNPIEEARAYRRYLDETGIRQEDLADLLGRRRQSVQAALGLLRLPAEVQRKVAAGVLSRGHARCLVAVRDPWAIARLADRIVRESLTVRQVEEIVALGDLPGAEGDLPPAVRRAPAPRRQYSEAVEALELLLDTRVRVEGGRSRGQIRIDFAGREDLERLLGVLSHGASRMAQGA